MAKILIVEDNLDMADLIVDVLKDHHHTVEHCADGEEARYLLKLAPYEIIVLDWDLPRVSGLEILSEYRGTGGRAGVIMLTGKSRIIDKESGFSFGADDYLTKPFDVRELVIRVRALLKRPPVLKSNLLERHGIRLDPVRYILEKKGEIIHLAPRDFSLLEFLMHHPEEVYSADALLARVWKSDSTATGESVRNAIVRIRKALDDSDSTVSIIENIPRVGYRIRPPEREKTAEL